MNDEDLKNEAEDAVARRDLRSKYAEVPCPVHGAPAQFEVLPDGSVVEHICCEALSQIIRELKEREAAAG